MRRHALLFLSVSVLLVPGCPAPIEVASDAGTDAQVSDAFRVDSSTHCTTAADCDDGLFCNGSETCSAASTCAAGTAPTCTDGIGCTNDVCVEARRACESTPPDADHDGHADGTCRGTDGVPLGDDCDDGDANRFPGNPETCDAADHDEDCSAATYGSVDADLDGHDDAQCCNAVPGGACGDDCDDANVDVYPAAAELCNGGDEDCDMRLDEGLTVAGYLPDCDHDAYGDAIGVPITACGPPAMTPTCATGTGNWVTRAGDCADDDATRNIGNPEVCNGIDDNCDVLVDDIIPGTVVCHAGQTRSCTNVCSVGGLETCNDSCLGWDTCLAAEVCNGCDDDGNGMDDDGFECGRGTSEPCTVPACGTTGTRVCSASCGWGTCAATEACNYCDDNGDGNFFEERPLASLTSSDHMGNCVSGPYTLFGPGTSCGTEPSNVLWAELLDGTANNQAGALWFDPSGWVQGWGPTEVTVDLEVRAISAGGAAEIPLGGWSVIVGHGGTTGVGSPQNRGMPTTIRGVAATWFWSTFRLGLCPGGGMSPYHGDSFRFARSTGLGFGTVTPIGAISDASCSSGDGIDGGGAQFDGVGTIITERLFLRYTPDDPTTAAVNEELVEISAGTPGTGGMISLSYRPSNDLPIGTGPLRIGITAGTYTQSGFSDAPGVTFGVPVRARARIWTMNFGSMGSFSFDYGVPITRTRICP
jgi:hypothetical protein